SDAKTWTFRLRSNVKWHDGQPFSIQDVAYTFNAIMNPKFNAVGKSNWTDIAGARDVMDGKAEKITGIETPDANTVIFKLTAASAPFASLLNGRYIVPEHLFSKEADPVNSQYNTKAIGTGPFKLVDWQRGQQITLQANPDYFLGAPNIDRIAFRIYPDQNA